MGGYSLLYESGVSLVSKWLWSAEILWLLLGYALGGSE